MANCTYYYDVEAGLTCQDVLDYTCLTIAQFYAMNPAVGADCSGLWLGKHFRHNLHASSDVCRIPVLRPHR